MYAIYINRKESDVFLFKQHQQSSNIDLDVSKHCIRVFYEN